MLCLVFLAFSISAQTIFNEEISVPAGFAPTEIVMPPSPLSVQILFVGGVDSVQTTPTYGNPATAVPAKEWHDFIGFTPDESGESLGWVSVNHEMIYADDNIGDGGGMTAFRVQRAADGTLEILDQTLADGRSGKFFNVDFANTVGETGMNCGGISSPVDGRIWTAEEWFRSSTGSIYADGGGVRDTADYTISSDIPGWDGKVVQKYENFNWMVEIDPKEAVAIRKQYNWARQPFEGGTINEANELVFLGPDATPCFFGMFVAKTPGDFTRGTLFAYKHDKPGYNWVPIWEDGAFLNHKDYAVAKGATMFNRIEWVAYDPKTHNIFFTETGRDNPGSRWADEAEDGGLFDPYHVQRAQELGFSSPADPEYPDYYGRIWMYDVVQDTATVYLEAGPFFEESPEEGDYPSKHLSNPDGLNIMTIGDKRYLVIQEDLNGTSFGRTPAGISNRLCELYLLDLDINNPTIDDLIRVTAVPAGAEITGAMPTPDGKSLLVNSQHPSSANPFPYNHSLTFAIHGFDQLDTDNLAQDNPFEALQFDAEVENDESFSVFPNPTTRIVYMNQTTDVAVYNNNGQRLKVYRNTNELDVSNFAPGVYYLQNAAGETLKLSVQ